MTAANFDPRFLPGAIVAGRFRIERMLGRGGMGAVYGALHLTLGQYVAIKVLQGEAATDPDSIARFKQEAQIVSRLHGANIVRVFDLGQTERGEPFIVMELLTGRDLDSVIAEPRTLTIVEAVGLIAQACVGVAIAHAAGLVHRDIKPANLFLARQPDGSEIVKVLDFGLSKVMHHGNVGLTQTTSSFGTPQYMSPEQIMSAKHVDARCDQHALGMILFELLTKKPPYEAENPGALTVKIVTQKAPSVRSLRQDVPAKLDDVIQKAMAKRPQDRYPDLGGFAKAIAGFGGADAAMHADATARSLRASQLVAVAHSAVMPGSDLPSASSAPTEGSFSSHHRRKGKGSSAIFWVLGATILTLAISATALLFVLRSRATAATASAASGDTTAPHGTAASGSEHAGPVAAPSTTASSDGPVSSAASSEPATSGSPAASSSAPSATTNRPPPFVRPPPPPPPPPPPTNAAKNPFDVFGKNQKSH